MKSNKLKDIPNSPGVYFHKDKSGEIIYIGKASVLKNRVQQYFQKSRNMDIKTRALVNEIADTDWIQTESEIDALFLEAEMVKRYMPRYNILLRDDKSLTYVRIDMKSDWPYVSYTRNPIDDGSEYFGPYYNSFVIKKALRYLRKIFPYFTKSTKIPFSGLDPENRRQDLDAHLGLSPVGVTSIEYKKNLRRLISYINGNRKKLVKDLERDMKKAASQQDYEVATIIRNKLRNLNELQHRIMFGDKEFIDISKDRALTDLTDLFGLSKIPVRIEGYDISHMSGTDVVASMVVFRNGVSDRAQYRRFKIRVDKNDDYFNMNEVISRRFSEKNIKNWGKPDLVLIDGGKGQLDAAINARNDCNMGEIPFIGLAKRNEQIVVLQGSPLQVDRITEIGGSIEVTDGFNLINLPKSTDIIKLLQRIRDESHRFAVNYHTAIRSKKLLPKS